MAFWSSPNSEPKRAYRWTMHFGGLPQWVLKKVSKPSFAVTETAHPYLNHKFYYPGRVEWNTVTCTLADPVQPDSARTIMNIIKASGYQHPETPHATVTMSKKNAVGQIGGSISIEQLGPDGETIEKWELINPCIKDAKFGELDYESDDMVDVELEIRYDYAKITKS